MKRSNPSPRKTLIEDTAMLVLSRKQDEKIIIGDSISLMVVSIQGDKVRLGIEAPKEVTIHREEVYRAIQEERKRQSESPESFEQSSNTNG